MSIGPVAGFTPLVPPSGTGVTTAPDAWPTAAPAGSPVAAPGSTGAVDSTGTSFGERVTAGIDALQQAQGTSDQLATAAATGDLSDVQDYMIASTKASLATELTVAVRNKAIDAFNEIMRMPL